MLSHLVRLPGPNQSSIALLNCVHIILFGSEPRFVCISSQQLFTPLLSNDDAGEGGKMHDIALCTFIYWRFLNRLFVYKASVHKALTSVLWMYCKCSKERWKRIEMSHTALCLQRVSHAHQESEWNTHEHTFLSNNTIISGINSGSLPWFGTIAFTSAANLLTIVVNKWNLIVKCYQ